MKSPIVAMIAVLLSLNSVAFGQSLGDIAKTEAERRKAIQVPSKVIREADLKPADPVTPTSIPVAAALPAGSTIPERAVPTAINVPPEAKFLSRDATYWLGRMRDLQTTRDTAGIRSVALQDRVNALVTDFNNAQDRLQQITIERELQKVRTERNLAVAELTSFEKQITNLEDEARRSNVPPGWLRP